MKTVKVKITDFGDLVTLNEVMIHYEDVNFDICVEDKVFDGKSIVGLLAVSATEFSIRMSGKDKDIKAFISEIEEFVN